MDYPHLPIGKDGTLSCRTSDTLSVVFCFAKCVRFYFRQYKNGTVRKTEQKGLGSVSIAPLFHRI